MYHEYIYKPYEHRLWRYLPGQSDYETLENASLETLFARFVNVSQVSVTKISADGPELLVIFHADHVKPEVG